jgi:hypothetical protein
MTTKATLLDVESLTHSLLSLSAIFPPSSYFVCNKKIRDTPDIDLTFFVNLFLTAHIVVWY